VCQSRLQAPSSETNRLPVTMLTVQGDSDRSDSRFRSEEAGTYIDEGDIKIQSNDVEESI
jgi:hypothetical protein